MVRSKLAVPGLSKPRKDSKMSLSQSKYLKATTKPKAEANPWKETTMSEGLLADLLTPFLAPNHKITRVIFGEVVDGQIPVTYLADFVIPKEGR